MIMVRGYAGKALLFQEKVDVEGLSKQGLRKIAEEHLKRVAPFPKCMIEIEFLDEPDLNQRFFRIGTDTSRMVDPAKIDDFKGWLKDRGPRQVRRKR